jgi:hypothetical protein
MNNKPCQQAQLVFLPPNAIKYSMQEKNFSGAERMYTRRFFEKLNLKLLFERRGMI